MVVATVMSNLGLAIAMRDAGIELVRTAVGDRYVLEEMERRGATLGGEQSGHVIFRQHATTGDGLLTAVRFLSLAAARGVSLAELAGAMRRRPQVMVNIRVAERDGITEARPSRRRSRPRRSPSGAAAGCWSGPPAPSR